MLLIFVYKKIYILYLEVEETILNICFLRNYVAE